MTTTYTLTDKRGEIIERGLTLADAGREILARIGKPFEIKKEGGVYCLYVGGSQAHTGWQPSKSIISTLSGAAAENELSEAVALANWGFDVMTDVEFNELAHGQL